MRMLGDEDVFGYEEEDTNDTEYVTNIQDTSIEKLEDKTEEENIDHMEDEPDIEDTVIEKFEELEGILTSYINFFLVMK